MKIHTQVAGDTGLFVDAYAVETAEAIVVIDTSLLVDDTADGHTTHWLSTLDKLTTLLANASLLYPGHGVPGPLGLLEGQYDYLLTYRTAVIDLATGVSTVDGAATAGLVARKVRHAPGAPLDWLIALGADAVAVELAREER